MAKSLRDTVARIIDEADGADPNWIEICADKILAALPSPSASPGDGEDLNKGVEPYTGASVRDCPAAEDGALATVIQRLYDSEINCGLSSFWDGGWTAWIGDDLNGHASEAGFNRDDLGSVPGWMHAEAARLYPKSDYAWAYGSLAAGQSINGLAQDGATNKNGSNHPSKEGHNPTVDVSVLVEGLRADIEHVIHQLDDPYTSNWGGNEALISGEIERLQGMHTRLAAFTSTEAHHG